MARAKYETQRLPFPWHDPEGQLASLERIEREISEIRSGRLAIVWCAGRCSFAATAAQTEAELQTFERVVALSELLAQKASSTPGASVEFHSVSSAGGLFEGRRLVNDTADRCPSRPYGRLKADQEDRLDHSQAPMSVHIYRPSSVFGSIRPGQRMGLIPVMMLNGLHNRVTTITGSEATLRDYVWNLDVARFLASRVLEDSHGGESSPRVSMLCSGKPTSIFEVRSLIEWMLMKRLFLSFSRAASNSADITFSPNVLPAQWTPVDLSVAARAIHLDWVRTSGQLEAAR